jgi:hypothetical protein
MMATMLIRLKIKPGCESRFEEIQTDLYKKTLSLEKDVLCYEFWRGQTPGSYYCILSFKDYHSFILHHQISAHHEAATPSLLAVFDEVDVEWVDPIQGASAFPPTNPQSLPADAPELARNYAQSFNLACADWWIALR